MSSVTPFSLKDAPALIERALPVQRLSAEAYKEQMSHIGKALASLGSYWKGRKPLILNKACVLGCILPATDDLGKDLTIFEMLLGMDDVSLGKRLNLKPDVPLPASPYRELIDKAKRPEELGDAVHSHVWMEVNAHLGTDAHSFPELVEQLGIMRFGHRPRVADTFSGSGQIPFEAARLGCDVYASDLNPVACMLTWGAFNIVGGSTEQRAHLAQLQQKLLANVQGEIDRMGIETDVDGWRGKVYLYCVEVRCPQTGWMVPLLPSLIVSKGYKVVAELVPDVPNKRYDILIRSNVSEPELNAAEHGTVRSDGRGQDSYMVHSVDGRDYRTKIGTLRGDYRKEDGANANRLRMWEKADIMPRPDDIYQERLYAVQWMRPKPSGKSDEYEFRSVSDDDLRRERAVQDFICKHLADWQEKGWIPDMRIEPGYNTDQPIRERGWTYWHHLFNPRQLLMAGLTQRLSANECRLQFGIMQVLNVNSRLSRWNNSRGGGGIVKGVFDNQALNTLLNYGCRGSQYASGFITQEYKVFPFEGSIEHRVQSIPATELRTQHDIYITDPPYGDAVKYEEILEFFIAWLRKNPPPEFADWVWDSRRALAIKGEDEDFRRSMVAAYKRMTECMPDNGIQVIMFTHQSGSIWADMANIVWASGLRVTAAWYVVTETSAVLKGEGSYVKGTVLLVLRKRHEIRKTSRDELAWDIKDEVEHQVALLTGLNQQVKPHYRDENLFADADLQMAGYAAALRVLTQYSTIDGKDMVAEAIRPRVKGQTTFVDELIEFAVSLANQSLVPEGIEKGHWNTLKPAERFYLKLLDLESKGTKTLDNYQNFAKAFKVGDFKPLMASQKANAARLRSAVEFGRTEMSEGAEFANTPLRAVLYAIMELVKEVDGEEVLAHLGFNVANFFDPATRDVVVELADYLAAKLLALRPEEASAARVLRELVRNQRM
jgi:putative DNA methylase